LLCVLMGPSVRGGEPAVVGALPEGSSKELLKMRGLRGGPERPKADADPRSDAGEGR
jgi:hypothetical protein